LIIIKKYSVLLILLLGLTACTNKMAYNNLDWIAAWYVDDYVSLTDTQEKEFEDVINAFVAWHRKSELPNYISQIKRIKVDIKQGVTSEHIHRYTDTLREYVNVTLVKLTPQITEIAYTLSAKQVKAFLAEVEERNLNRIEKTQAQSAAERDENRLDKITSRIESFVGDLNREQRHLLVQTNQALLPTFEYWIAFRRAWAASIQEAYQVRDRLLASEGSNHEEAKATFNQLLSQAILETNTLRSEAHLAVLAHNRTIWAGSMEKLMASLSAKQLKALNNKLNETIDDLQALI